jgi:MinD-like ATPase involved in chromosome partitioning or flagellar assembly
MYITTFYSFKGGVGRTFALVNVAVELAKAGRKVLLVDFDLEAPGIHTFDALRPSEPHPGVVEYVTDYVATRSAPDVRDYIYEAKAVRHEEGRIWVMPAGRGAEEYRQRLASIDWQQLYRELDGYLFFEDLKAQWWKGLSPDYVLIDSRTGHTDIEGICTRQFPDAVVILFFPNEQNLAGLREVVGDIESETRASRSGRDPIKLHFVMSNVPDLDDEDGILRRRVHVFRGVLKYNTLLTIHNYPSLALLNQTIFTLDRSKSRLAKEYHRLKDEIVSRNDKDPEGAIQFLKRLGSPHDFGMPRGIGDIDERLRKIQELHGRNGEVLFRLGIVRKNQARLQDAVALFDKSIASEYEVANGLLERAICRSLLDDREGAASDAIEALHYRGLHGYDLHRLIDLLGEHRPEALSFLLDSPSFHSLEPKEKLLTVRALSRYEPKIALTVYQVSLNDPIIPKGVVEDLRSEFVLDLIRTGHFHDAMDLFGPAKVLPESLAIQDAFNYGMAEWADVGVVPKDLFRRVVALDSKQKDDHGANRNQCLAVALWAIGCWEEGLQRLALAEDTAKGGDADYTEFSCWCYRTVGRDEFLADCRAIRGFLNGGNELPSFFPKKLENPA